MIPKHRRAVPSWRATEARAFRPELALAALGVLAALLLEVWQSSAVASMSVQLGRANHSLSQANAESEWTRAQLDRGSNRSELSLVASAIGLQPLDPQHIVSLPEEYLEPGEAGGVSAGSSSLLASAGRVLQAIVPDASARGRRVN